MEEQGKQQEIEIEEVTAQENVIAVRDLVPMRAAMDDSMERIADMKDQFSQTIDPILRMYNAAMCATTARLEIIEDEFKYRKLRCPIHHIDTRLKSAKSILGKLQKKDLDELNLITRLEHDNIMRDEELLSFWNRINDAKEIYRDKTYQGVSGKKMVYHTEQLAAILEGFLEIVTCGIKKARRISGEICPTYFTYEVPEYEKLKDGGIRPLKFVPKNMPYFLEGPVQRERSLRRGTVHVQGECFPCGFLF